MRAIVEDELAAFVRADSLAFGATPDAHAVEDLRGRVDLGRTRAVFDGDDLVAASGTIAFELSLPGATCVRAAGVSWVGVVPTHRRRGALRLMMGALLGDAAARNEAVAILTASESHLYGRFGFGVGTSRLSWRIDRRHAALASPGAGGGRVELLDADRAATELPPLFDRARLAQPGDLDRDASWWAAHFREREGPPDRRANRFHVLHRGLTGPDGYAIYRVEGSWDHGVPKSRLVVHEVVALDPAAEAALWKYLFAMDLVEVVEAANRPVDEPLRWLLADPRRLQVSGLRDELWVQLLDIPAALAARRYGADGELVLEVAGAGRYRLSGGTDGARCEPGGGPPDLTLGPADLGAVYLGGVAPSTLARAGRVEEHRFGALARADAMFASHPAPFCRTGF